MRTATTLLLLGALLGLGPATGTAFAASSPSASTAASAHTSVRAAALGHVTGKSGGGVGKSSGVGKSVGKTGLKRSQASLKKLRPSGKGKGGIVFFLVALAVALLGFAFFVVKAKRSRQKSED